MIDQEARNMARETLLRYDLVRQEIASHVKECELSRHQAQEWRAGVGTQFEKLGTGVADINAGLASLILKATSGVIGTFLIIIGWLAIELYHR